MSKCDFWQFWLGIQNFPKLSLLKLVNFKICWAIYPIEDQFRLEISRKIFSIWVIPRTYCSLKFTSIARRKIYTRTVTLRSDKSMLLNFTNLIIFCNKPKFFCDSNCMFSKTSQNVFLISQGATEGVDWAQKLTRPKHAFSGRELPREQRFIVSFRRVRQGHVSDFEKKLLGYLVKIENGWSDKKVY